MARWNWQREDWPRFSWDLPALLKAETLFSESVGVVVGGFEFLDPAEQDNMVVELMTCEAYDTSQIEGENLDTCITSLASTILRRKDEYYRGLDIASRSQNHDVTEWLSWFAAAAIEGNRYTEQCVKLQIHKAKLLERLDGNINMRQQKALLRMFSAGLPGFADGLSAKNYRSITGAPAHTATRDLADLIEKAALVKTGELKATRYHLNIPDLMCPRVEIAEILDGGSAEA